MRSVRRIEEMLASLIAKKRSPATPTRSHEIDGSSAAGSAPTAPKLDDPDSLKSGQLTEPMGEEEEEPLHQVLEEMPQLVDDNEIVANEPSGLVAHQVLDEMSAPMESREIEVSKEIHESIPLQSLLPGNSTLDRVMLLTRDLGSIPVMRYYRGELRSFDPGGEFVMAEIDELCCLREGVTRDAIKPLLEGLRFDVMLYNIGSHVLKSFELIPSFKISVASLAELNERVWGVSAKSETEFRCFYLGVDRCGARALIFHPGGYMAEALLSSHSNQGCCYCLNLAGQINHIFGVLLLQAIDGCYKGICTMEMLHSDSASWGLKMLLPCFVQMNQMMQTAVVSLEDQRDHTHNDSYRVVAPVEDQSPKVITLLPLFVAEGVTHQLEATYVFDPGGNRSRIADNLGLTRLSLWAIATLFLLILEDKDPSRREYCDRAAETKSMNEKAFIGALGMNIAKRERLQLPLVLIYDVKEKLMGLVKCSNSCCDVMTFDLGGKGFMLGDHEIYLSNKSREIFDTYMCKIALPFSLPVIGASSRVEENDCKQQLMRKMFFGQQFAQFRSSAELQEAWVLYGFDSRKLKISWGEGFVLMPGEQVDILIIHPGRKGVMLGYQVVYLSNGGELSKMSLSELKTILEFLLAAQLWVIDVMMKGANVKLHRQQEGTFYPNPIAGTTLGVSIPMVKRKLQLWSYFIPKYERGIMVYEEIEAGTRIVSSLLIVVLIGNATQDSCFLQALGFVWTWAIGATSFVFDPGGQCSMLTDEVHMRCWCQIVLDH